MVTWAPRERHDSLLVHDKLVTFHFLLDQPALKTLQSPVHPDATTPTLTPLSAWIVDFARAWGSYLDTGASAVHVDSFRTNAAFHWDDYMAPPSGYLTFNQFFARHVKPGRRPVDALCDDRVLVAPADASFIGQWPIAADSTLLLEDASLRLKGLRWSLEQLLAGSPWAGRFAGGVITHSALRTFDYHRWHAPAAGTVLEARVIQGRAWLDVHVETAQVDGMSVNRIEAVEGHRLPVPADTRPRRPGDGGRPCRLPARRHGAGFLGRDHRGGRLHVAQGRGDGLFPVRRLGLRHGVRGRLSRSSRGTTATAGRSGQTDRRDGRPGLIGAESDLNRGLGASRLPPRPVPWRP